MVSGTLLLLIDTLIFRGLLILASLTVMGVLLRRNGGYKMPKALAGTVASPGIYRWVCFGILCLGYAFANFVRFSTAVIVPDLTVDLSIGPTEVGFLSGLALWGYAASQIPIGLVSDTLGVRKGVTVFLFIAAAGTVLFAVALDFSMVAIGRLIMGVGTGIVFVSALKFLTQWFRVHEFGTLNGLLAMFGGCGSVFAAAPLAMLVGATGWRSSFLVLALFAAILALLAFAVLRDRNTAASTNDQVERESSDAISKRALSITAARFVFGNRNLWLLGITAFTVYGVLMAILGLWGVSYLVDVHGLSRQTASTIMSIVPIGSLMSAPIAGFLSDRVFRNRKWLIFVGILLMATVYSVLAMNPTGLPLWVFYVLFFCLGIFNSTYSVIFALVHDIVPHDIAGTSLGFFNMWNFVGGAVFQPVTGALLGFFSIANGQIPVDGYRALFLFCVAALLLGAFALFLVRTRNVHTSSSEDSGRETVKDVR